MKIIHLGKQEIKFLLCLVLLALVIFVITLVGSVNQILFLIPFAAAVIIFIIANPIRALSLFVLVIPLENLIPSSLYSITKLTGIILIVSFLLHEWKNKKKLPFDLPVMLMILFLIWSVVSLFWTIDSALSIGKILTYGQLFAFYLILRSLLKGTKELEIVLLSLWLGGMILIASGIWEMSSMGSLGGSYRLAGITGNANTYMINCLTTLPGFYMAYCRGKFLRVLSVLGLLGMFVTILQTQSRGGLISLAVFFLCLLMFRATRKYVLLLIPLVLVAFFQFVPEAYLDRFTSVGYDPRTRDLWPAGLEIWKNNFLLGTGIGTNGLSLQRFSLYFNYRDTASVHSAPLTIAIEIGLIGLIFYLGFIGISTWNLFKNITASLSAKIQKNYFQIYISILLFASIMSFLTTWAKGGGSEDSKILWLLLGIASSTQILLSNKNELSGAV